MINMNKSMYKYFSDISKIIDINIPKITLKEIKNIRFYKKNECIYIKSHYYRNKLHFEEYIFNDEIESEIFINEIYLNNIAEYFNVVNISIILDLVFKNFNILGLNRELVCVLSIDDSNGVLHFYTYREGKSFLSENLEGCNQPVLQISSTETNISESISRYSI